MPQIANERVGGAQDVLAQGRDSAGASRCSNAATIAGCSSRSTSRRCCQSPRRDGCARSGCARRGFRRLRSACGARAAHDPVVELDRCAARAASRPRRLPARVRVCRPARGDVRSSASVARATAASAARHSSAPRMSNVSATSSGDIAVTKVPLRGRMSIRASAASRVSASLTGVRLTSSCGSQRGDVQPLSGLKDPREDGAAQGFVDRVTRRGGGEGDRTTSW